MRNTSNLARDLRDYLVSETPVETEPFEEPCSIRGCHQALFHGPDQDAQRGHEPDSQNLAGPQAFRSSVATTAASPRSSASTMASASPSPSRKSCTRRERTFGCSMP